MLSVLYVPFYNKKLQRRTILNIFYSFVKKKKTRRRRRGKKVQNQLFEKNPFYNFRQLVYKIMYQINK